MRERVRERERKIERATEGGREKDTASYRCCFHSGALLHMCVHKIMNLCTCTGKCLWGEVKKATLRVIDDLANLVAVVMKEGCSK